MPPYEISQGCGFNFVLPRKYDFITYRRVVKAMDYSISSSSFFRYFS